MPPDNHAEIKRLLEEDVALAKENLALLKKMHRASVLGLLLRIAWFAILVGVPFILYFYLLEPYLGSLKGLFSQLPEGHFLKLLIEAGF